VRITALASSSLLALALALPAGQLMPLDAPAYTKMLGEYRGKVVLVDFWATWCDPCREELPKLAALSRKLDARKFVLVTVSADEPEQESAAATFLDRIGIRQPRYIKHADDDQAFIDSIDKEWSGALPALFLYNASGVRIASFTGESDPAIIEAAIRKAL
jgi:thiol-disulfide isomerase/thioredoxin